MDVDGFTGGYNLQAAFSSGYVAGKKQLNFEKEEWMMKKIIIAIDEFAEQGKARLQRKSLPVLAMPISIQGPCIVL